MSKQHENGAVLTGEQLTLLAAIQDRLIPAGDGMPGAGAAGCAAMLDRFLSERPARRGPIFAVLAAIEVASGETSPAPAEGSAGSTHAAFLTLSETERDTVLRAVEAAQPALFRALVNQTYSAYYTNPAVLLILGWNPPQPAGFPTPPPFDEALLANVKRRGKVWRDA